jgi:TonB-linked SusC/RagA family outer membrane protein
MEINAERKRFTRSTMIVAATAAMFLFCGANSVVYAAPSPQAIEANHGTKIVSGTVTDDNGEPVIGASVMERGTTRGTSTDIDGKFSLRVGDDATLTISYVGLKSQQVKAQNGMKVTLKSDNALLDEVVVVGYGQQKKVNLTGAVSTVDVSKTLEARPQQDVSKALQGAVPGLQVISSQGGINVEPTLKIRGMGTLSNGTASDPLIIVDGVEMSDISYLNPNDIANISVLKDAASTSIYGTKAAFGVVLITTKTGKVGDKVQVTYTDNFAWDHATFLPNYPDVPSQIVALSQANKRAGAKNELFGMDLDKMLPYAQAWEEQNGWKKAGYREMRKWQSDSDVGDYLCNDSGTGCLYYADWDVKNIMFKSASPSMSHQLSIQGSTGKTTYYMSVGYNQKEGQLKFNTDKLQRYNATINLSTNVTSWLQLGGRFFYSDKIYKTPETRRDTYQYLWRWGSFFSPYGTINGYDGKNDIAYLKQAGTERNENSYTRLTGFLKANITKDITLNADYTWSVDNGSQHAPYVPLEGYNSWGLDSNPSYFSTTSFDDESNTRSTQWDLNVYANYEHTFLNAHHVNVMLGANAEESEYKYVYAEKKGYLDKNMQEINLTSEDANLIDGNHSHAGSCGYFGRINYDYNGIYLLELNGRYDGSSKFPENDRWAFFKSGSIGYRFSQEKYFEPARQYVSNGKFRASYGEIGNQAVGSDMFISTIASGNANWVTTDGTRTIYYGMPSLVSSTLKWERIRTLDLGLDLAFLNDRFTLGFDWFQRDNKDMLAPSKVLPATLGDDAPYVNAGTLRTTGWELNLGWNQKFGEFNTYVTFNISDAKTKVKDWSNDSRLLNTYYSGQNYGDIWGFETDRYFTTDDFNADGSYKDGVASQKGLQQGKFVYGPGDIKFKDLNGDGVIDAGKGTQEDHGDLKVIGNSLPRYEYSFHIGGSWRGIDLDAFFQGVGKRKVWTQSAFVMPMMRGTDAIYDNQTSYCSYDYTNGTYDIDQSYDYPRMYGGNGGYGTISSSVVSRGCNNFYPQSRYIVNMSYLRFKNLTVGYTLPKEITQKAQIEKVRIYFSGQNICLLHNGNKYNIDPEINTGSGNYANGVWGRIAPITKSYSFGLQVTF